MSPRVAIAALLLGGSLAVGAAPPSSRVRIAPGTYQPPYTLAPAARAKGKPSPLRVEAFELERFPVTNRQYLEFVQANPGWRRSRLKRLFAEIGYLQHWKGDLSLTPEQAEAPVTQVSWFAARAYARWKGLRLPTQLEWEYAAQASAQRPDGSKQPEFRRQILDWYGRPTPKILPPVSTGFRNYYGVQGMHGLVWEWVEDFNNLLVTGESRGDSSLERDLYCAGGSVGSLDPSDYASSMRYAFRSSLKGNYCLPNLGFRCARSLTKE